MRIAGYVGEIGHRQAVTLRHGLGGGWELLLDLPAVSHTGGDFDGFIEGWHDAFGLPQSDRDRGPRDRLALFYGDGVGPRVDIGSDVHSLGEAGIGVGYALRSPPFSNDGVVVRAMVKLPGGDAGSLAGSGGFSASMWTETSGAFPASSVSRRWLYRPARRRAVAGVRMKRSPRHGPSSGDAAGFEARIPAGSSERAHQPCGAARMRRLSPGLPRHKTVRTSRSKGGKTR